VGERDTPSTHPLIGVLMIFGVSHAFDI